MTKTTTTQRLSLIQTRRRILLLISASILLLSALLSFWPIHAAGIILLTAIGISMIILGLTFIPMPSRLKNILPTLMLLTFIFAIGPNLVIFLSIFQTNPGRNGLILTTVQSLPTGSGGSLGILSAIIIYTIALTLQLLIIIVASTRTSAAVVLFTLDSLPGRQMAIEAEEYSGTISLKEAIRRKNSLQRECDFLGSLDGVNKLISVYAKLYLIALLIALIASFIFQTAYIKSSIILAIKTSFSLVIGNGTINLLPAFLISMGILVLSARRYPGKDKATGHISCDL